MGFAEQIVKADKRFNKAFEVFNRLPSSIRPDHEQEVRGTLMQATKGDNHTDRPDIRAITKWHAWAGLSGIPKYEAQEYYAKAVSDVLVQARSNEGERLLAELHSVG